MKKLTLRVVLMVISILLCFTSCDKPSAPTPIALTPENIYEYFSFDCEILDYEIIDSGGITLTYYYPDLYDESYGTARLNVYKKSESFILENVEVSFRLSVEEKLNKYMDIVDGEVLRYEECCYLTWKFKTGNVLEEGENGLFYNRKNMDIIIPYNGIYSYDLHFCLENNENQTPYQDNKPYDREINELKITIEILDVSGYVIVK